MGTATSPTLEQVLEAVGLTIVHVLAAPSGLGVPVVRPIIHDPTEPPRVEAGDLVLAVAMAIDGGDAVALVELAGGVGAAAVAFKAMDLPERLAAVARSAGVAVLGLAPSLSWEQAHTVLRTAVSAGSYEGREADAPSAIGDLFGLANAIAALVGGPTTIEDTRSTVLAYSSLDEPIDEHRRETILGRRVSEEWRNRLESDGFFRRLWSESGPILIEYPSADPPLQPRLAIAVRAGDENLASIWVADGGRGFGTGAEQALTEVAPIAALHLLRWRATEDLDRERRGAMFRSVLEGSTDPEVLADALDIGVDARVTVLAFRLDPGEPEDVAARGRRAVDLVALSCESYRRRAVVVAIGPVVYALVPDDTTPDRDRLTALAADVTDRLSGTLRTDVRAGIGSTRAGLAEVAASRRHADQVLDVLTQAGDVAAIEQVRSQTVLASLRMLARRDPELRAGKLQDLAAHDARHGTEYVPTLKAYLDAFGDVAAAAAAANVHPNTLRYRLRRLVEIVEIDLDDPIERLVLHLQLHLDPSARTSGGPPIG